MLTSVLRHIAMRLARPGLALAAALAVAVLGPGRATALEIKLVPGEDPAITRVELSGPFARGDAQRVQTFLAALPRDRQIAVTLNSQGGLIDEALRLGRHFHANRVRTEVAGAGRECLSACALAFLGGRDASGAPFRVKGTQAQVGLHGFRRIVPDKEFTVSDMHEAIAVTQQVLLSIADYLMAVDADIEFMSMMLDKPNTEMNYLANEKASALGVRVIEDRHDSARPSSN